VAELLSVEPGDHVFEIGTGPGILGAEVAVELPGAEIIGIDISAGMAQRAKTQGVYSGVARTNFERLPFTTAFFSAVYTGFVFH
jgi:ubiquinone/menaquinone biosynthesis C-methylase UbiE